MATSIKTYGRRGAISLGLEVMILIVIAIALLVVILFLIRSGIIGPISHLTNVTNQNVTIP
jgi:hypothetical protein